MTHPAPLRTSMTARLITTYADMLRRWAGVGDHQVIDLAGPAPLRGAIVECARAADAMAEYLALPTSERRHRAPLRRVMRRFSQAHQRFGCEVRAAVRLAARSSE